MSELIPVTDEQLERARGDRNFRRALVSEHLDRLMIAMSRASNAADTDAARHLQEGARLAVKLTEIFHGIGPERAR
jgi:hypothetical protein